MTGPSDHSVPAKATTGGAAHGGAAGFERTPPKSARRRSRELAMQGLYQWLVSADDAGAIEAHLSALRAVPYNFQRLWIPGNSSRGVKAPII